MPVQPKAQNDEHADDTENYSNKNAELPRGTLRAYGRGEPPFAEEIPDPDAKVKRRSQHAYHKKSQIPWISQIALNGCVGRRAVRQPPLRVQVPSDVGERD